MMIKPTVSPQVISAATSMLQAYIPDLSPKALIGALRAYEPGKAPGNDEPRPLTRQEAAALLSVSVNSINTYLNKGILRRIKLTNRAVRVCPASVRELLSGNGCVA